jgi:hypothetical protein
LLSLGGALLLRDAADGSETPCEGADISAVFSSTPALREIRGGEEAVISCDSEIAANLPLMLEPVLEGDDASECLAEINGEYWAAYPTLDGDYVMVPGCPEDGPDMSPCWAEHTIEEGESNPLMGWTSIGLATPTVAVEYARYSHGGFGGGTAVAIRSFDDFAAIFVDWLVNWRLLEGVWEGDTAPYSPTERLFAEASRSAEKRGYWNSKMGEDDQNLDDDQHEDDEYVNDRQENSAYLKLHLSDELVEQVRARLESSSPGT